LSRTQLEDKALTIERACDLARVSRASYYRAWEESQPRRAETELRDRIQKLSLEYPQHGSRRIAKLLSAEGPAVNRKCVQRLMREDNLLVLRKRRYVVTTDARHTYAVYPNLAGEIEPVSTNQLWVADITYVRLRESFVYLAVILDAWSRRVVGWNLGETLTADLALGALEMALEGRCVTPGIVHHSDRGVQYCSHRYVDKLRDYSFQISMSRAGNPYDNALAESFMRTLKCEEVYLTDYRDAEDARMRIGRFLDDYYNRRRLHSSLGYQTPEAYERSVEAAAALGSERDPE
jgi:putative transposase